MKLVRVLFLAVASAGLLSLNSCVTTMVMATVNQATMSSSWKADYIDKTDSDRITVKFPIQKIGESAMLRFEKVTPRKGGDSIYSVSIDYTNAVGMTAYDSIKFIIDDQSTVLQAGPLVEGGSVASDMVAGAQWNITYSTDTTVVPGTSVVDPAVARKLIADILAAKVVEVKNYQKGAGDKFIDYKLTAADQALFSHL